MLRAVIETEGVVRVAVEGLATPDGTPTALFVPYDANGLIAEFDVRIVLLAVVISVDERVEGRVPFATVLTEC